MLNILLVNAELYRGEQDKDGVERYAELQASR